MSKLTITSKFRIGTACILLLFCAVAALAFYYYLKAGVTRDIYRETEIFVGTADATRTYVKDVLRPRMTELLPSGAFIPHAMSTTFVGREIMRRLRERFPDFAYKRAASNPMNPLNQADAFELEMLDWFNTNRDRKEWHGVIKKNNLSFYARLRAIYAEAECLRCHGQPEQAPLAVRELYGTRGGYHYRRGQVVAADTIYIPVDVSFVRIKEAAWTAFIIAIASLFSLFALFYLLFNRTVVTELKGLLQKFRNISDPVAATENHLADIPGDEVEQLRAAFENVAHDLEQAHGELKTSESKYRLLFESSQDAILIFDKHSKIVDINEAGIRLFGFKNPAEAYSVETYYQLFWDTRDAMEFHKTIQEKGFIQGLEVPMVDRDGRKRIVMVSATEQADENRQFEGVEGIFRDVTEKRRVEQYLAQTEKLASIGELASGVAHEINNPLGVIKCYGNLIAKDQTQDSQVFKDIQIIRKHTDQCKTVVESLLNFARVSEPQMDTIDIHTCIEEILAVLEHQMQKGAIAIAREYDNELPQLTVDAQMMKQVFMNLLMNAIQAMPDGGQVTIRTIYKAESSQVALIFTDTGVGISTNDHGRIFDPFFTTKGAGRGTGLGLSVSYGIIKQHKGEIEVEGAPGKGTTFTIRLPIGAGEEA